MAAAHDPKLLAIDPDNCGCTECLIGEYRPLNQATDEDIKALFRGEIRDHTSTHWWIEQNQPWQEDGFTIIGGPNPVQVPSLTLPLPVEYYRITLYKDAFEKVADGYCEALGDNV